MADDSSYISRKCLTFDDLKLSLTDTNFRKLNLQYRGEGNENLVLQARKINYILRFRKHEIEVDSKDEDQKLMTSFWYYYVFVKSLFDTYCTIPVLADVPKSEVRELDHCLFTKRPECRKKKRIFYNGVQIHPDFTFIPTYSKYENISGDIKLYEAPNCDNLQLVLSIDYVKYRNFVYTVISEALSVDKFTTPLDSETDTICIEIKPKQAWVATPDCYPVCAYCMNQYLKLKMHKIKSISKYCPLDLFSGNIIRMKRALTALVEVPQNNLKIFKNGTLIFGEHNPEDIDSVLMEWFRLSTERCMENFCDLIMKILTSEFASDENTIQIVCEPHLKSENRRICPNLNLHLVAQSLATQSPCLRTSSLPQNSVLGRIRSLQKIDEAGIETTFDFLETYKSEYSSEFGYIDKLIAGMQLVNGQVVVPKLNVVETYLLSAAAKDLSILIAVKRVSRSILNKVEYLNKDLVLDLNNQVYETNVSVVDVGPKPISTIRKHWKRDEEILTAYAERFCPESIII